jgi:hypothetical protein
LTDGNTTKNKKTIKKPSPDILKIVRITFCKGLSILSHDIPAASS